MEEQSSIHMQRAKVIIREREKGRKEREESKENELCLSVALELSFFAPADTNPHRRVHCEWSALHRLLSPSSELGELFSAVWKNYVITCEDFF